MIPRVMQATPTGGMVQNEIGRVWLFGRFWFYSNLHGLAGSVQGLGA